MVALHQFRPARYPPLNVAVLKRLHLSIGVEPACPLRSGNNVQALHEDVKANLENCVSHSA
jgi:hypothetical protein